MISKDQLALSIKAIAVCGKSNVGKTSSILMAAESIIEHLQELYGDVVVDGPNSYGETNTIDKWYILTVKEKRIAIFARGDDEWSIGRKLEENKDCDFYICTSHLMGKTINCLTNFFCKNEILFVNKIGVLNRSIREFDPDYEANKTRIDSENKDFANIITDLFLKYFVVE